MQGFAAQVGVTLGSPTFADNCPGASVSNDAPSIFPKGTTTVTWTVTDASGHTATATQTVTVVDNENPTITAPSAVTVNTDAGLCSASGVTLGSPTFADNCPGASVSNDALSIFPKGTTTVTWTVTDVSGHTATATQTVTVVDNENPTITAPSAVTVNTDAGLCSASGVTLGSPTFADNCPGASVSNDAPSIFPKGTTTVTWTVTDASGRTATATQTVKVEDHQNPTLTCKSGSPFSRTPNNGTPICTYKVVGTEFDPVSFNDNCPGATITNNINNSGTLANAILPTGSTTIVWTVTDASGNSTPCSIVVNIASTLTATISTNNPYMYFGYSGIKVQP